VLYYTVFNEGWGQFHADECYKHFKALDSTRIFDTTSGWFKNKLTDVDSEHVYFKPVKLKAKSKPLILSEFGGYSCKIKDHSVNIKDTYGYRYFNNTDDFENALVKLYENEIIPCLKSGLNATVLTQVSDVEDETNGLLTYDRQVLKVNSKRLLKTAQKLYKAFYDTNS
jgi:glycosyltransferase involved in cell wall biosynthesis